MENENKILVVDIETTGFLGQQGSIVEVGIVELCLLTGDKNIIFNRVINPNVSRASLENTWIVKNGYMTVNEIEEGFDFSEIKDEIQDIINQYELGVTAFNRSFDIDFLKAYGIKFNKLLPCPMIKSTSIIRLPPTNRMKQYRPDIKYKTPNAEEAYKFFYPDADYIELHRGADDAFHEADIVYKLYKM